MYNVYIDIHRSLYFYDKHVNVHKHYLRIYKMSSHINFRPFIQKQDSFKCIVVHLKWSTATMNDIFTSSASWITDISESVKEHRSLAMEVIEA